MKHPCAWCNERPVVYLGTEYCSYKCWAASLVAAHGEQEEDPEPQDSKQLDLFEKLPHTL